MCSLNIQEFFKNVLELIFLHNFKVLLTQETLTYLGGNFIDPDL